MSTAQDQPEESPGKPPKTAGQQALEEIKKVREELGAFRQGFLEPMQKWAEGRKLEEKTTSEQPSSVRVPFWRYCPTGDCKDGPHEVSSEERKKIVKCPGCGQLASTDWNRCATCGHEGTDFEPPD